MNRREALIGLAMLSIAAPAAAASEPNLKVRSKTIKPKRLKRGNTIGVISPASGVSDATFERGLQNLRDLGFQTRVGNYARGGRGFLSGTDKERLHDLHWAFRDREIDGIWCMRGGYGTSRLLPDIDYKLIAKNPKVFVGYSDITALHLAIARETGLVTFHGPNAASSFSDYTIGHIEKTLIAPPLRHTVDLPLPPEGADPALYQTQVISSGQCRGRIIGGNLSMLIALNGTRFGLSDVKGKILFIEDINEQPYRVDRMLTQLRQSVDMTSLAGIAVGVFTRNEAEPGEPSQSLLEVLHERLGGLGIPVVYGLSFGHIRDQFVIPIGIRVEMDTSTSRIILIEMAVT